MTLTKILDDEIALLMKKYRPQFINEKDINIKKSFEQLEKTKKEEDRNRIKAKIIYLLKS